MRDGRGGGTNRRADVVKSNGLGRAEETLLLEADWRAMVASLHLVKAVRENEPERKHEPHDATLGSHLGRHC